MSMIVYISNVPFSHVDGRRQTGVWSIASIALNLNRVIVKSPTQRNQPTMSSGMTVVIVGLPIPDVAKTVVNNRIRLKHSLTLITNTAPIS